MFLTFYGRKNVHLDSNGTGRVDETTTVVVLLIIAVVRSIIVVDQLFFKQRKLFGA